MTNSQRTAFAPAAPWRPPQSAPAKSPGMFGTVALLVGAGVLGAYLLDLHSHTCDRCGRRWRHFGAFNFGDEESHTCTRCGEVQWWKCGAPHVMRGSLFVTPPPACPSARSSSPRASGMARIPAAVGGEP